MLQDSHIAVDGSEGKGLHLADLGVVAEDSRPGRLSDLGQLVCEKFRTLGLIWNICVHYKERKSNLEKFCTL